MTTRQRTKVVAALRLAATSDRTHIDAARQLDADDDTRELVGLAYDGVSAVIDSAFLDLSATDDVFNAVCLIAASRVEEGWNP